MNLLLRFEEYFSYPLLFGVDVRACYKSLWLGWILVVWTCDDWSKRIECVAWRPGL